MRLVKTFVTVEILTNIDEVEPLTRKELREILEDSMDSHTEKIKSISTKQIECGDHETFDEDEDEE
jgi:hypothetical protein